MKSILGRCIPSDALYSGIRLIPDYLGIWHYIVDDFFNNFTIMFCTVLASMVLSLLTCVCVARFPHHAFLYLHVISIVMSSFSGVYFVLLTTDAVRQQAQIWDVAAALLFAISAIVVAVAALLCFAKYSSHMRGSRGLQMEVSRCLRQNPKLLSQSIWTSSVGFLCALFHGSVILHSNNCSRLVRASSGATVTFSSDSNQLFYLEPVVVLFFFLWLLRILKFFQSVITCGLVARWYFSKKKREEAHPITRSCKLTIKYNIGSVICCSLNGWLFHLLLSYLACPSKNKTERSSYVQQRKNVVVRAYEKIASCLSPFSAASIGVYGRVAPTAICALGERPHLFIDPGILLNRRSRYGLHVHTKGIYWACVRSHAAARWCVRLTRSSYCCFTVAVFYLLLGDNSRNQISVPSLLVMAVFLTSHYISGLCLSMLSVSLDTVVICFIEDMTRNNGRSRKYYGSRNLIYLVTGAKLSEKSTYTGIQRMAYQRELEQRELERRMELERIDEAKRLKAKQRGRREAICLVGESSASDAITRFRKKLGIKGSNMVEPCSSTSVHSSTSSKCVDELNANPGTRNNNRGSRLRKKSLAEMHGAGEDDDGMRKVRAVESSLSDTSRSASEASSIRKTYHAKARLPASRSEPSLVSQREQLVRCRSSSESRRASNVRKMPVELMLKQRAEKRLNSFLPQRPTKNVGRKTLDGLPTNPDGDVHHSPPPITRFTYNRLTRRFEKPTERRFGGNLREQKPKLDMLKSDKQQQDVTAVTIDNEYEASLWRDWEW